MVARLGNGRGGAHDRRGADRRHDDRRHHGRNNRRYHHGRNNRRRNNDHRRRDRDDGWEERVRVRTEDGERHRRQGRGDDSFLPTLATMRGHASDPRHWETARIPSPSSARQSGRLQQFTPVARWRRVQAIRPTARILAIGADLSGGVKERERSQKKRANCRNPRRGSRARSSRRDRQRTHAGRWVPVPIAASGGRHHMRRMFFGGLGLSLGLFANTAAAQDVLPKPATRPCGSPGCSHGDPGRFTRFRAAMPDEGVTPVGSRSLVGPVGRRDSSPFCSLRASGKRRRYLRRGRFPERSFRVFRSADRSEAIQ